jgi:hypothetical protein
MSRRRWDLAIDYGQLLVPVLSKDDLQWGERIVGEGLGVGIGYCSSKSNLDLFDKRQSDRTSGKAAITFSVYQTVILSRHAIFELRHGYALRLRF